MSRRKLIQLPLVGTLLLGLLGIVYLGYLVTLGHAVYTAVFPSSDSIVEHTVNTNASVALQYWTADDMRTAINADETSGSVSALTQDTINPSAGKAARQEGQAPSSGESSYPLSTVGKVFFSNASGQNMVCSGTAIVSNNHNTVDTAGHCLYWNGGWVQNLIFCPLYNNGTGPYGCWAARALEVPSGWINTPNNFHEDFGMVIVSPNSKGNLTDVVGGAGWAYNQAVNQSYSAYGYPAAGRFDGQTRQSCQASSGKLWQMGGGTVVSIPCDMTGGSSGGPWFIQSGNNWYVSGHNDFTSNLQPGHMFSPYYNDTWYALYNEAQQA
jgi:V8-like Glu-specific endopeptidase